jgi:tRNA nucleotidyltransferase (CCA-adding enzyme)
MPEPHITSRHLASFAEDRVNLPSATAQKHRDQVNSLRERLASHIADNPGFALVKMLHAGSVAKGTALRNVNDLDVAVYVKSEEAPEDERSLINWMADRLREANPNMHADQFDTSSPRCVTIRFRGSGLDVDVVPVLYEGDPQDKGYLVSQDTGERLLTSVPLHIEFIRKRKREHGNHFAQVVRFIKWWANQKRQGGHEFKCKSFLIELLLAKQADEGKDLSDYTVAVERFFSDVAKTQLKQRVAFTDNYPLRDLPVSTGAAIEVFDPVNPENNVAERYDEYDRQALVDAAIDAADAIAQARYSNTKAEAVENWQIVLGPSFRG